MAGIRARVLGVYGEDDARINTALPDVTRQMQAAGANFRYDIYAGTGHGFLKPGRRGSDGPAVGQAWAAISAFLAETIGP
jgi:dienelactone hydrolase